MYFVCCKILGVKPGSDIDTIKSAYRKAAKELHPDLNHFENASQYFIILQNAYKYLLDHPFSEKEIELIKKTAKIRQTINLKRVNYYTIIADSNPYVCKTLQEILAQSNIARMLFLFFHLLFLVTGIYLVYRSVYDIFHYPVDPWTPSVSAYLTIVFAFLFGIVITTVFLFSGINFVRRR
jgi:curved DNA-binding protein CbpA